MNPFTLLPALWLAWAISWLAAARWASPPAQRATGPLVVIYRASLVIGFALIIIADHWSPRLWRPTIGEAWLVDALVAAGFAFCWWARLHLGRLWSSAVTIKPDHHIVDSGPYGLVRHPIYTGLMLAITASALVTGTLSGIVGGLIMLAGMAMKARLEEATLRDALGHAAYDAYARRTPMLVPFLVWAAVIHPMLER